GSRRYPCAPVQTPQFDAGQAFCPAAGASNSRATTVPPGPGENGDVPTRTGPAFTVATPRPLPAEREGDHWILDAAGKQVKLTNLPKVYWPEQGYTKGDLLAYYFNVADASLPHLTGRTLTLKRMPDGIAGPSFLAPHPPKT